MHNDYTPAVANLLLAAGNALLTALIAYTLGSAVWWLWALVVGFWTVVAIAAVQVA